MVYKVEPHLRQYIKSMKNLKQDQSVLNEIPDGKNDSLYKLAIVLFAFVSLWVPFFGYAYINAYLTRLGFDFVNISVDVYSLVLVFFSATSDGVLRLLAADMFLPIKSQLVHLLISCLLFGVAVFIFVFLKNRLSFRVFYRVNGIFSFKQSVIFGFFAFISSAVALPFMTFIFSFALVMVIGIFWFLAMAGYFIGMADAADDFNEGFCFQKSDVAACSLVKVDGIFQSVDILYSDSAYTYMISPDGLIVIRSHGESVFKLPMREVEIRMASKSNKSDKPERKDSDR